MMNYTPPAISDVGNSASIEVKLVRVTYGKVDASADHIGCWTQSVWVGEREFFINHFLPREGPPHASVCENGEVFWESDLDEWWSNNARSLLIKAGLIDELPQPKAPRKRWFW
jgi:hypothetical protein